MRCASTLEIELMMSPEVCNLTFVLLCGGIDLRNWNTNQIGRIPELRAEFYSSSPILLSHIHFTEKKTGCYLLDEYRWIIKIVDCMTE